MTCLRALRAHLPWCALTRLDVPWRALTCLEVPWRALTCLDVPWRVLTYLDVPWCALTCLGVLWRYVAVWTLVPCVISDNILWWVRPWTRFCIAFFIVHACVHKRFKHHNPRQEHNITDVHTSASHETVCTFLFYRYRLYKPYYTIAPLRAEKKCQKDVKFVLSLKSISLSIKIKTNPDSYASYPQIPNYSGWKKNWFNSAKIKGWMQLLTELLTEWTMSFCIKLRKLLE